MKTRNLLTVALAFLASTVGLNAANRAPSLAAQIVNTGISLNQQISSSSLNSAVSAATNGGQFVITKSGRYFLSTDILAAPAASRVPCIYINASDVVLDLGGKTLTLSSTTRQINSAAIEVAAGKSDITIMNGTINGYNGQSSTYTHSGIKIGASTSNILLDNVHVVNFGYEGVYLDTGCSDAVINNVHTYNIGALGINGARGLSLISCNDVNVLDSTFNKTSITNTVPATGIWATSCNNLSMNNVQISNTTGATGTVRGVYLNGCTGVTCDNVKVLRATSGSSAAPVVAGFDIIDTTGSSFTNCLANNCLSTNTTTSTYGFRLSSSSSGSNSNNFVNCEAKNNVGYGTTAGISLESSHYNTFQNCNVLGNGTIVSGSTGVHMVYGIKSGLNSAVSGTDLSKTCSGNTFKACKISSNSASSGNAYGIALSGDTGATIQNCEIKANVSTYGTCYGIALHHTGIKNVVEYNTIYSNYGGVGKYGFKDFAYDSTTLLRGNVAFGHGATFAGGTSYITDSVAGMNYFVQYTEQAGQMNVQFLIKEGDIANMNAFEVGSPTWFNFSILHNSIAG